MRLNYFVVRLHAATLSHSLRLLGHTMAAVEFQAVTKEMHSKS
jgi:hypothetical protein